MNEESQVFSGFELGWSDDSIIGPW
jgi:hypothetical protein